MLELARVAHALDGNPVIFERVSGFPDWRVVAGICSDRKYFALGLDVPISRLTERLAEAMEYPSQPEIVAEGPCQEVVARDVDLDSLPILTHLEGDAGPYVTSSIVITEDLEFGRNVSFHRLLRLDKKRFAARLVENRGTYNAWQKSPGDLPVAICIGVSLPVLLAGSMSPAADVDELAVANALSPFQLVKCLTNDLHVPADAEIVLEGRVTHEQVAEGPFLDLTETNDIVRQQPVIEIDCVTHRRQPIYHALLPGGLEHKLLMGMPREPTIFAEVNKVVNCRSVAITTGGASWLHAVVQIDKRSDDDGRMAIEAAFRGHGSLKHVWVVDGDIDPYDADAVEWALATRFQADQDLIILSDRPGSSLDPSALHIPGQKSQTAKAGFDCTMPLGALLSKYEKGSYGSVIIGDYLPESK